MITEQTKITTDFKTLGLTIFAVAISVWAYFGIVERLNLVETQQTMMQSDLGQNTEFRIKWPRGEMGSLPADSEQFMLIEHLAGELESLTVEIETGQAPFDQQQKLMMEFFEKRINHLEEQIEKIKDTQLEIKQKNGH